MVKYVTLLFRTPHVLDFDSLQDSRSRKVKFFVVFLSWPSILNMNTCPYELLLIRLFIVGAIATRSFSRPRNKKIIRHYT